MRKGTKIALAAGAIAIVGAAGLSSMATADSRGSGGTGYHGWSHHGSGHHGMGMQRRGYRGMGHKGWGMQRMMERFDTNEDGKLTQEELDEARKTLLAAHDADKDGKLNLAEYEKLWLEVKRQRMVRSFQRTDRDGDASITIDEFLKPYAKMVARMDRNNDGVLDSEDRGKRGWRGRSHHMDGKYYHGRGGDDKDDKRGGMGQGGGMGKRGG